MTRTVQYTFLVSCNFINTNIDMHIICIVIRYKYAKNTYPITFFISAYLGSEEQRYVNFIVLLKERTKYYLIHLQQKTYV